MNAEGEIRRACSSYVQGLIGVEDLESRVWDALTGAFSPDAMTSVLKEMWTDARLIDARWDRLDARIEKLQARF